jgi:hypothetical protein
MLCVIAKQLARITEKIMLRDNRLPVFLAGGKDVSPSKINTEIDGITVPIKSGKSND